MGQLNELVSEKFLVAFLRVLVGDPPVKVSPLTVGRKPGGGIMRARRRMHSRPNTALSIEHTVESGGDGDSSSSGEVLERSDG